MSSRDDKVYARCFKRKPYGHALFKQVSDEVLRPGTCGYFDFDGDWHSLFQLIEEEPLDDSSTNTGGPIAKVSAFVFSFFTDKATTQDTSATNNESTSAADTDPSALSTPPVLLHSSKEEGPWGAIISEGVKGSQIDIKVEGK
jgi:hypothetical protein